MDLALESAIIFLLGLFEQAYLLEIFLLLFGIAFVGGGFEEGFLRAVIVDVAVDIHTLISLLLIYIYRIIYLPPLVDQPPQLIITPFHSPLCLHLPQYISHLSTRSKPLPSLLHHLPLPKHLLPRLQHHLHLPRLPPRPYQSTTTAPIRQHESFRADFID